MIREFSLLVLFTSSVALFSEMSVSTISHARLFFFSNLDASTRGRINEISRVCGGARFCSNRYIVSYTFHVDGVEYQGNITCFRGLATYSEIEGKYWDGKDVEVFYDHANPRHSVLQITPLGSRVITPLVLIAAIFLGGTIYIIMTRPVNLKKRRQRRTKA